MGDSSVAVGSYWEARQAWQNIRILVFDAEAIARNEILTGTFLPAVRIATGYLAIGLPVWPELRQNGLSIYTGRVFTRQLK